MRYVYADAVRSNPLASNTTRKTLQMVTAKWLAGARDREGGHQLRLARYNRNEEQKRTTTTGSTSDSRQLEPRYPVQPHGRHSARIDISRNVMAGRRQPTGR